MNDLPVISKRKMCPSHPGGVMKALYLDELGITLTDFAAQISVSRKAVSAICNGKKSVTPEMAIRIGKALGTDPGMWLTMQHNYDLWQISHQKQSLFDSIKPLKAVASLTF